jgi:expansin (peptidoglycan-binding protein)
MKSSSSGRLRLLWVALPLVPLACVSGGDPVTGSDERAGASGSGSGHAGTGAQGGAAGGAGKGTGGSLTAGTSMMGSGGVMMGAGGASGGVGGSLTAGTGGSLAAGTGGSLMGVGGAGAMSGAGGVGGSLTAGTGGNPMGSGGVGATSGMGGTGNTGAGGQGATGGSVTDPCAGVTCGTGQTCSNGTCMCMTGMLCGTSCVDVQSDGNNCGACGTKCDATGACVDGKCVNPMCNVDTQTRNGHVTHYTLATSMVACHYPTSSLPQYYGAMNEYDWNTAGVCGACVEITNGGNKLTLQITDECPYKGNEQWCFQGSHHIDLNDAAYGALGANNNPAVTWKYVSCNTSGNLKYYFDAASQQYYLAVTPMNHKNPVAKMEVKKGTAFTALTHTNYNTYTLDSGAGTGTLTFRLTDIYNHVVTDTVNMTAGQIVNGNVQFAACP